MSVTIDGQLAASLRVDAYWHSGYVPIGTPISEPAQDAEPEWIESRYFPHFPSTDRIFVIPVWTELWKHNVTWVADFRINQSCYTMMALTLVGMQGIINRSKPRIYLNFTRASNLWIPNLEEHVDIVRLDFDHLSALNFLLERYGSRFTGAVIYDLEVPETINLATMIAGLEDRIILAPVQLQLPGIPDFTSVTEPRQLVQEQGWDTTQ
ncbi:MAG: GxGYxYP domain-containing protein, partial [Candidatus Heimdallarchaeota archaeon]